MRKVILGSLAAAALAGSAIAYAANAPGDESGDGPGRHWGFMQHEPAFMLDAKLAGMKAALKLNPDQEKAWGPFEAAVRDAYNARREEMKTMRDSFDKDERPSPIDRLNMMSDGLGKASAELKKVADAAKPLYDGLDDQQKRRFGPLLRTLAPHHPGGDMGMGPGMGGPEGHHPHGEPL